MARLTDLPPEVRLRIYDLLLVDPVRDGLRITMTFDPLDNNQIIWGRARCAQTEQPHKEGHSADFCCVDVSPSTLHHLDFADFADLWSLARTSRTFYVEATPTIYNNADIVYSSGIITLDRAPAFTPPNRYLEQQSPTTKAMFQSLFVHDEFATVSVGDMKLIVDTVHSHLTNLRVFGYHISKKVASSRSRQKNQKDFRRRVLCAFKVIQPLTCSKTDIHACLKLRLPTGFATTVPQIHRRSHAQRDAYVVCDIHHHEAALERGDFLEATSVLRSTSVTEERVSKRDTLIEKSLARMQEIANSEDIVRRLLCQARRST